MKKVWTVMFLFLLWLLMSGIYEVQVIMLGIISVISVLFIIKKMDKIDNSKIQFKLKPISSILYFAWLTLEIFKANWQVTKIILSKNLPDKQQFIKIEYSQHSDLGQVIFANSITLTPGTISVEIEPGYFLVHALDHKEEDNAAIKTMDRKVSALESPAYN